MLVQHKNGKSVLIYGERGSGRGSGRERGKGGEDKGRGSGRVVI